MVNWTWDLFEHMLAFVRRHVNLFSTDIEVACLVEVFVVVFTVRLNVFLEQGCNTKSKNKFERAAAVLVSEKET